MKLKRLSSLVGLLAALLIFTGGRALAVDAIAVVDAQAFPGGSDTVDVLVTTDAAYPGAEITLSYDKTKLSTAEANVIMNDVAWDPSGGVPTVAVDTAAGTIKVAVASLTVPIQTIPQSSSAMKLFSVVFDVDSTVAVDSYTVTPSGSFMTVDVDNNYEMTMTPVTSLTSGVFVVQSLYNMSVDSVDVGPGVLTPVGVNLTNGKEAVSVEFTITFDSSQVVYGDSIEINDLYVGGNAEAPTVTNFGDSIRVAIFTGGTATIPVSNTSRWIAKPYFVTATGASETASNPLVLSSNTTVVTTTGAPDYAFVNNTPNLVDGNFNIQSKYSLRIGSAAAPKGGRDTVKVYLRAAETVNGVEAELTFSAANFTLAEEDITFNTGVFSSGEATVTISLTDSSAKIAATPGALDIIAGSNTERLLFSVIMGVKDTATVGYDSLDASGILTQGYGPTEIPISAVAKGVFRIVAPYELEIKSRSASPQAKNVPVTVLMTNEGDVLSAEIVVKYDTTKLTYVAGSVAFGDGVWTGTAPTPDVTAAGDSLLITMVDLDDLTNKIEGGGARRALMTIGFDLNAALATNASTSLTLSGLLVGLDNTDPTDPQFPEYTAKGVAGTLTAISDIIPPKPVTMATATVGASSVSLGWKNPDDTDLDYVKIVRNAGADSVVVLTREDPVAGATDSFEDVTITPGAFYYYTFMVADQNGNMGENVVVPAGPETHTVVRVTSATALAGGLAYSKIKLTNPEDDIAGMKFKLTFDPAVLQITDIVPGADAAGLSPVTEIDVDSVNASGVLMLDAIDTTGSPALKGAAAKTVVVIEFMVDTAAATGATTALALSEVDLSDPDANAVELLTTDGTVTIVGSVDIDLNLDGQINLSDIWYYFNQEELVVFESIAELIATLLNQPLPTSMLAAVQDAVATSSQAVDGAMQINLKTNFEIVAARFTFSYDKMYELNEVFLSQDMAGRVMIKKVVADGRLYVDIVSLDGFVPAEVGNLFSVAFSGADHEAAGLTLDKIEVSDRDGNVSIESAQAVRITLPKAFALSQNSPNPFNPSTTIKYQVPEGDAAKVQIVVFNVRGQKVITLVDELKESGDYTVNWNGTSTSGHRVSSGVYFYRMSAGEFSAVRKMVIVT